MLRLGSATIHDVAGGVGKQRQDSSVQLSDRKREAGWSQKPRNSPNYSTVVYNLSKNIGLGGSHQFSLIPIGQSQIVRQKSSKTFAPTFQLLANDSTKTGGKSTANKGCAYSRKYTSEYVRTNSKSRNFLNNIIKQKKSDENDNNNLSGQTTTDLNIKKEVSFLSITKRDGKAPKRPWHDPNFHANQNSVIADYTGNEQSQESSKETISERVVTNGTLQNQECSTIKNIHEMKAMGTSTEVVSSIKTAPFEKSSLQPFFGNTQTTSLTKPHPSKIRDSNIEQNMQIIHATQCCGQQNTKLEMSALTSGERLTCSTETEQKDRKENLKPIPANIQPPVRSARVITKQKQNSHNENHNSNTRGSEESKIIFSTFLKRGQQKFGNTSPDIKRKLAFPNSSGSSKTKEDSSISNKRKIFSTTVPKSEDTAHSVLRKPETEQFAFNPMHTEQLFRLSCSNSNVNCENNKNNGFLSLNSKNLILFEIFTSKGNLKFESKTRRIYKWLEDCQQHNREKLFRDLEAKINNC